MCCAVTHLNLISTLSPTVGDHQSEGQHVCLVAVTSVTLSAVSAPEENANTIRANVFRHIQHFREVPGDNMTMEEGDQGGGGHGVKIN